MVAVLGPHLGPGDASGDQRTTPRRRERNGHKRATRQPADGLRCADGFNEYFPVGKYSPAFLWDKIPSHILCARLIATKEGCSPNFGFKKPLLHYHSPHSPPACLCFIGNHSQGKSLFVCLGNGVASPLHTGVKGNNSPLTWGFKLR